MKVLVTGGNGFIGSHFADKLLNSGEDVTLLDLEFTKNTAHMDCEKIVGDVTNMKSIADAVRDKDFIFHFAAVSRVVWGQENPEKCITTNVIGMKNILECLRTLNKNAVVFLASSKEVYGNTNKPVSEDHPKDPVSVYAATKLAAERLCIAYHKTFGINFVVTRFSSVYGSERDRMGRVTPTFMMNALKSEPLNVTSLQTSDFTFIDDAVQGIYKTFKAYNEGINGQDFHFATGKGTSVKELAEKIVKICNSKSKIIIKPVDDYYVENFVANLEKSRKLVKYEPKYSLEEGLKMFKKRLENFL